MGQRAGWIIDIVLEVFWDVFGGVSSPVDDNPVTVAPPGGTRTTSVGATRTTSALNDRTTS